MRGDSMMDEALMRSRKSKKKQLFLIDTDTHAIVPKEPSDDMWRALWPEWHPHQGRTPIKDRPGMFDAMKVENFPRWRAMLSAAPPAAQASLPPLDDDLSEILGMLCFRCGPIADILRKGGSDIPMKTEAEQASVIHWLLQLYFAHKSEWRKHAGEALAALIGGAK